MIQSHRVLQENWGTGWFCQQFPKEVPSGVFLGRKGKSLQGPTRPYMALDPGIGIPQRHHMPSQQVIPQHPETPDVEDPSGLNSVENSDKFSLKLAIDRVKNLVPILKTRWFLMISAWMNILRPPTSSLIAQIFGMYRRWDFGRAAWVPWELHSSLFPTQLTKDGTVRCAPWYAAMLRHLPFSDSSIFRLRADFWTDGTPQNHAELVRVSFFLSWTCRRSVEGDSLCTWEYSLSTSNFNCFKSWNRRFSLIKMVTSAPFITVDLPFSNQRHHLLRALQSLSGLKVQRLGVDKSHRHFSKSNFPKTLPSKVLASSHPWLHWILRRLCCSLATKNIKGTKHWKSSPKCGS